MQSTPSSVARLALVVLVTTCAACAEDVGDPGRVTLHRLNRAEYDNTVRDLLGTDLAPARDFPADDHGYGFDNVADVLATSPLQVELYANAAHVLVADLLRRAPSRTWQAERLEAIHGARYRDWGWRLWSHERIGVEVEASADDDVVLTVRAGGRGADGVAPRLAVVVDGIEVATPTVDAAPASAQLVAVPLHLAAGPHRVELALHNPSAGLALSTRRELVIDWLRIDGKSDAPSARRARVLFCDLEDGPKRACAREVLRAFSRRALRRPPTRDELERQLALVELGVREEGTVEAGVALALEAVLLSPHFLYRVELDPDPTSTTPHPLNDHALAARLSYFLWSSTPDDRLLDLAEHGGLRSDDDLKREVARMLDSDKARALTDNFAGQWLYTRALDDVQPEQAQFPTFDGALAASMRRETELFFESFLRGAAPVEDMLTADFTFADARLAAHYGIAPPASEGFARVSLVDTPRRGLLTQGSLLTVTSYPTRTSPVRRGKWVLQQLLCSEPPPPPPGVESLESQVDLEGSLRTRLEQHRAATACQGCHSVMDPIGFSLEHFDPVGAWRAQDGRFDIDATGVLPDGRAFDGAVEMARVIAGERDPLLACVGRKLFTYAHGKSSDDDPTRVDAIAASARAQGGTLRALIEATVLSPTFRMRRGEALQESAR